MMAPEFYLVTVIIGLLAHSAYQAHRANKLVSELTSKLMARDFREYAAYSAPRPAQAPQPMRKVASDPTLGSQY